MPQIALLNYEDCTIDIVTVSAATWEKYAEDFDILVYDVLGYRRSEVCYMTAIDSVRTRYIDGDQL